MIYLDYASTTPIDEDVMNTYINVERNFFANTTSIHKLGQESNYMLEKMIKELKEALNIDHNVVFTTNATEANNLALYGVVGEKKGRLITTKVEHPSVYKVFKDFEKKGYEVKYLNVNEKGVIDLNELKSFMSKDTLIVSIMWVNNVVGAVEPIEEVIKIMKDYPKAKLHVDIAQGICKEKPKFNFNDVDLLTFSTHKIYGPKGVGVLLYKKTLNLEKRLFGSKSQYEIKPGTISLALVASTTKAIKKFYPLTEKHYNKVKELNDYLKEELRKNKEIIINSKDNNPYILNISIPKIKGETFVHVLEEKEIYVSTGTSCSSKYETKDRVIKEITKDDKFAETSIRISLSFLTTKEELKKTIEEINRGIQCMI